MSDSKKLYKELHKKDSNFGSRGDGGGITSNISHAIQSLKKANVRSIIDYGTGKGALVHSLRNSLPADYIVDGYDPSVEEWENKPEKKYDIVTCVDVLEHLEITNIDEFIISVKSITHHFCFLVIDLQPAVQILSNGRNAHTLLAPHDWWASKIASHFSTTINFPILNKGGFIQKYIVTASNSNRYLPEMMLFVDRLKIYDIMMINPRKK